MVFRRRKDQRRENSIRQWRRQNHAAHAGRAPLRTGPHLRRSRHRRPRQQSLSPVRGSRPRLRLVEARRAILPCPIPQELTPGSITVEATGDAKVDGKNYEGLRVSTSDLEVLLALDSNHRLMRLEVPSAKVSVVRE